MDIMPGFTLTDIETTGARIHLRHGGDGPPLLLLHGNPLTHASWHKVAPRLAEHSMSSPPICAATATASAPTEAAPTTSTTRSARWRRTRSR